MEKVILINSPVEKIKEKHYDQPDMPRISLAYLASYLLKGDISCEVIDAKYEHMDHDSILKKIRKSAARIIGFTAMTTEIMDSAKLALKIKAVRPEIVTVIGGPHASALPKRTLEEFQAFDIACVGEGEHALKEIVPRVSYSNRSHLSSVLVDVKGIAYREKDNYINLNAPRSFVENLDELPYPAWHLFRPAKKYPVLGSRGCPFRCNFCMRVLGDHIRFRDPSFVVDEMREVYKKYKPNIFEFYDETFGVNKEKTHALLEGIIKSGLHKKIKWHIQTRVDMVNEELIRKMKDAGCSWVGFGVETGNSDIMKASHKGITKEKVSKAIAIAKKTGLATGSFFILGHPNETKKTVKDTINFALKLNTTTVSFGIMTPYPGTEIAEMAKEKKGGYRLLSEDWSNYNKQTCSVLELDNISNNKLQQYQLQAYLKFYLFKPTMAKIKNLLEFVDIRSLFNILLKRIFRF